MSRLTICADHALGGASLLRTEDPDRIAAEPQTVGVRFER